MDSPYKNKNILLLSLIFIVSINGYILGQAAAINKYTVGYTKNLFYEVDINDVKAALNLYTNHFIKSIEVKVDYELEAKIYDNMDELMSSIEKDKIAAVSVSAFDFIINKGEHFFKPAFIPLVENKTGVKFQLLVRKKDNISSLKALQNKTIGMLESTIAVSSNLWLDYMLSKNKLPSHDKHFSKVDKSGKESQIILNLFFGKVDACIISEEAFNLMKELNPQVGEQLTVLAESDAYVPALLCITKWCSDKIFIDSFLKNSAKVHESAYGKQILTLLKVSKLHPYKEEYLNSFRELIRLNTRHNIKK